MNVFIKTYKQHREKILALSDQGLVSAGNFTFSIFITRLLGLENFGIYTLCWTIVLFTSNLHQALIIAPMTTFAGKMEAQQRKQYFGTLIMLQLLFSILAFFVVLGFVKLLPLFFPNNWHIGNYAIMTAVVASVYTNYDFFRKWQFVELRSDKALLLDMTNVIGLAALLSYLYFNNSLSIISVFGAQMGGYLLAILVAVVGVKAKLQFVANEIGELLKKHIRFSSWLMGTSLLQWFSGNFFIVSAGALLGAGAMGVVRIAQNIHGVLNVLFLTIENYVPVRAAKIYKMDGQRPLTRYLTLVGIIGFGITAILCLLLMLFSDEILHLLYKDQNSLHAEFVAYFGAVTLCVFVGFPIRIMLRSLEYTRPIFSGYVLSTVFSLIAANHIINSWGMAGVVIGLAGTQLIMSGWNILALLFKMRNGNYSYNSR